MVFSKEGNNTHGFCEIEPYQSLARKSTVCALEALRVRLPSRV